MRFPVRLLAAIAVACAACASSKTSAGLGDAGAAAKASGPSVPGASLDPTLTVATVNGTPVTGKELDDAIHGEVAHENDAFLEKVDKIREAGLDEIVAERIVAAEAKARGIQPKELIDQEIVAKVAKPTDEEVRAFYERVVKPQQDVPFEAVQGRILDHLAQEKGQERGKVFFNELRAKYKVKLSLPVRRIDVAAVGPSRGPADAKVTILEFSDFQCPYCSRAIPTVEALMKKYDGKVRLVFRQFPLPMHELAAKAAEGALCANEQGKFWQMHDKLFGNQARLQPSDIKGYAKELGLDPAKFDSCLDSGKMHAAVEADMEAGRAAGVDGTPAFFINGRLYSGAQPQEKFESVIDAELGNG